jgi:hypothetical protein
MKKLMLLFFIATGVGAEDFTFKERAVSCGKIQGLAEEVMKARQYGVKINKVLSVSNDPLTSNLVITAYKKPRFNGEEMKKDAIDDFGNDVFITCMEHFK